MSNIEPSIIISIVALLLSMFSIYQQWIKPRRPRIAFLPEVKHRSVLRPYKGLPTRYQQDYPDYHDPNPGYAIVHLPFGNTGNGSGLVKVAKVHVVNRPEIKASFYNYLVVPPGEISLHPIVLRNIPPIQTDEEIELEVEFEWGEPQKSDFLKKGSRKYRMSVELKASPDVQ